MCALLSGAIETSLKAGPVDEAHLLYRAGYGCDLAGCSDLADGVIGCIGHEYVTGGIHRDTCWTKKTRHIPLAVGAAERGRVSRESRYRPVDGDFTNDVVAGVRDIHVSVGSNIRRCVHWLADHGSLNAGPQESAWM